LARFIWKDVKTKYREERASKHGTELRWLVNDETIEDTETGKTIRRAAIRHPGICVIVPFVAKDQIVLMRQYRFAANQDLWELPAGTLNGKEDGNRMVATESPEACAARELLEETGYEAGRVRKIAECFAMPGTSDEMIYVFFASELTERSQSLEESEIISEIRPCTAGELAGMISRNEIRDAKTLVGLFYALTRQPHGLQIS
jgi:ADP-ribose diphosphatase